jgi:hypothetical protein
MAEDKKPQSIFQGVVDAINGGKKKTPTAPASAQFAPNKADGLVNSESPIEEMQQQFLDWQVNKIAHNLYTRSIYFDTDRISAYQDFRAMDMSPEIAAALNIIRDECLDADTLIPLLSGEKITIEELYNSNRENFYVYSYNADDNKFEPGLCQRVTFKGNQDVYKITFDDDSFVMATSEHLWLKMGVNEYIKTCELKEGTSIEPFYSKISDENERIQGYEMLLENGKWEYTHRIVKREIYPNKKGVVHHKDIKKLNNNPSNLEVMSWKDHQDLHHKLNSQRWKNNDEYAQKMRKIFSEINSVSGPYWSNEEWRNKRISEMSKRSKEKYSNFTPKELKEKFSFVGEKNGMFGKGYKLRGESNGRFLQDKIREFSTEELISAFKKTKNIEQACELLGTTRRILYKSQSYKNLNINRWEDIGFKTQGITLDNIEKTCEKYIGKLILENSFSLICKENNWNPKKTNTFLIKNGYGKWTDFVAKYNSKEKIFDSIKSVVKTHGNISLVDVCDLSDFEYKKIDGLIQRSKYKNFNGLKASINHKVKSVEFVGKRKTYDLVNVGKYHNFAILTSNGTGVISHNCLTRSEKGNILEIYSENSRVKEILKDLFGNRINVDYNLKLWIRDLVKYGDYFVFLEIDKTEGIYNFLSLPVEEIHREEAYDGNPESVRFRWETMGMYFEDWQVAHFRMLEDTKKLPYGRSILDPARKLWKQLQLAEDSMLVYRITRAPERRVFYIEVGNLGDQDVQGYMMKIQNQIKKQPVVDSRNGQYNLKYDPMNITEDYFIPIRGDKSSKIDTLPGASNMGDIQDIEYLQNKLFASLQVPKAYLNYAENLPGGSTLSQADLRFSRTINSIQEVILLELRRIANIHLFFSGLKDEVDNFTLTLTNPSTQQELLKLETMKARMEVFKEMYSSESNSPVSYTWAMENVLGFSKAEIKLILKQKKVEKKIFAEIDASVETYKKIGLFKELDDRYELPGAAPAGAATTGEEGAAGGGGGGGATGGMGNMELGSQLGGMDAGGGAPDAGAEAGGAPEAGGAEEVPLAENRIVKIKRVLAESDRNADDLLLDLLGNTEDAPTLAEREENENKLLHKNKKLNYKIQKMIENIQTSLDDTKKEERDENEKKFQEIKTKNTLFERSGMVIDRTNSMFKHLEEMMSGNKVSGFDVEKVDIINEEFVEEVELNEEIIEDINEIPNEDSEDKTEE